MRFSGWSTVPMVLVLIWAGCARQEYPMSSRNKRIWQPVDPARVARAKEAPAPNVLPATHFAAARLLERQGSIDQAIHQYRLAVAVHHEFAEAYHRLGILLSLRGQHEEAATALRKAVTIRPDDPIYRNDLGFEMIYQERWSEAEHELRKAVEISPALARAQINLGLVLGRLNRVDEALVCFRRVLPEPDAFYNAGLLFRAQRRYDDAIGAFQQALALNPSFSAATTQIEQVNKMRSGAESASAAGTTETNPDPPSPPYDLTIVGEIDRRLPTFENQEEVIAQKGRTLAAEVLYSPADEPPVETNCTPIQYVQRSEHLTSPAVLNVYTARTNDRPIPDDEDCAEADAESPEPGPLVSTLWSRTIKVGESSPENRRVSVVPPARAGDRRAENLDAKNASASDRPARPHRSGQPVPSVLLTETYPPMPRMDSALIRSMNPEPSSVQPLTVSWYGSADPTIRRKEDRPMSRPRDDRPTMSSTIRPAGSAQQSPMTGRPGPVPNVQTSPEPFDRLTAEVGRLGSFAWIQSINDAHDALSIVRNEIACWEEEVIRLERNRPVKELDLCIQTHASDAITPAPDTIP